MPGVVHRSLYAVFEHSWRQLSEQEQKVFRRLSVMRGSFSRQAAAQWEAFVLSGYTHNSYIIRTDGVVQEQQAQIVAFWRPYIQYGMKKTVCRTTLIELHAEIAHEISQYHFAYQPADAAVRVEEGSYLAIWRHRTNRWQIIAQAFSSNGNLMVSLQEA